MQLNEISSRIIKAAINVHNQLGPGLLESVYQRCMIIELEEMGLSCEAEVPVKIKYKNHDVSDEAFRIDLLVEGKVIIELKSVEQIKDIHKKQLLTYLRLNNLSLGLLINFNEIMLKNGITRIVNNFKGDVLP